MSRNGAGTRPAVWLVAALFACAALYPAFSRFRARRERAAELDRVAAAAAALPAADGCKLPEPALSLRVQRLSGLLSSWQTVGGCGAGTTGGVGTVKWVGRNTSGGLFQDITQANYIPLKNAYNLYITTQVSRDINDRWNVGVLVPFAYKQYNNYMGLPVNVSNAGLADINLLGTYKFGEIRDTALTASLGLPTGAWDAQYKMDYLTQEKQLGIGKVNGSLTLDHTIDETWGLIVLGGIASWRGGENSIGNYRAPFASAYAYAGYLLGPFVPTLGVAMSGFLKPDRTQGVEQDVPLLLASANASIEWSNDWIAILLGISVPFGLYAAKSAMVSGEANAQPSTGIQPWTAALGVSISPF